MAADLISSSMMDNLENTPLEPNSAVKFGGPFRATQLWNDVISHLKDHVSRKRRRVRMRAYDNCFSGSDAVDVVYGRLLQHRDTFNNKDVSRDKALKLCRLMVENYVFEAVGGIKRRRSHNHHKFDDSSSKFYRFCAPHDGEEEEEGGEGASLETSPSSKASSTASTTAHTLDESSSFEEVTETRPINRSDSSLDIDDDDGGDSLYNRSFGPLSVSRSSRHSQIVQEIMDITGSWKRYSSECLRRKLTPARLFKSCPSLPSSELHDPIITSKKIPPAVEEELWREIALSQLLTLLDIPMLDGILSYDMSQPSTAGMAYSNLAFRRVESISSLFSDRQDLWLEAATDVLECIPQGFELLDKSLSEETDLTQKLRMYQSIADYYTGRKEPLWSDCFADMHVGILNLLMQGRRDAVLRCTQLSILLLPHPLREEIRRLLAFMKQAADSELKLSFTMENRLVLEKTFTPAILRNKILTPHQAGQLVSFMMDHADKLGDVPDDTEDLVLARIDEVTHGMKPPVKEVTFCSRISESEYRKHRTELTDAAIVDLMNSVIDNTRFSLKDKKHRLKQFQKTYPKLYNERFSDMKW